MNQEREISKKLAPLGSREIVYRDPSYMIYLYHSLSRDGYKAFKIDEWGKTTELGKTFACCSTMQEALDLIKEDKKKNENI